jgi:predicted glycoside hydrolase/deacetylase ChbG (UPF0249 family)
MSEQLRTLVVNADDFGLSAGVNAGIIGAFRRGIVRSASLMVTTPGFEDAVELAHANPDLDLGIHLTLTNTRPVLDPAQLPSLVGRDGRFHALPTFQVKVAAKQLVGMEIRAELLAQVARARRTKLRFTHLDGHHHVHLFGLVATVTGDIARQHRIPIVRRIEDAPCVGKNGAPAGPPAPASLGEALKRGWLESADRRWGGQFFGLPRGDAFRGFTFPDSLERWRALADSLPYGVTELMCHPGLRDESVRAIDPYVAERERELRWLCDPRVAALLQEEGVTLSSFRQLLDIAQA